MERTLVSEHRLVSDYSMKGRIKNVVIAWVVFFVLLGVTRIPAVQDAMTQFSRSVTVDWVTGAVDFIINGFWFLAIFVLIGTVVTLIRKQTFDTIRVYDTGIGFLDSKSGEERYADHSQVKFSHGQMQESFYVESKAAGVKMRNYGWGEFAQPDVLRNNLERYGNWGV